MQGFTLQQEHGKLSVSLIGKSYRGHLSPTREWETISQFDSEQIPHRLYCLDLAPSNFLLFGLLKEFLRETIFQAMIKGKTLLKTVKTQSNDFYVEGIKKCFLMGKISVAILQNIQNLSNNSRVYIYIYIYIRGAFNKCPDFFVQAFKIVVDSWKFSML